MERKIEKRAAIVDVTGEKKTRKHRPTRELLANGMCAGDVCML